MLVQERSVWDSLNHNDYQPAHVKVSSIPRLAQELNVWDSLHHNDYQPSHVKVSPIPRLVQELDKCITHPLAGAGAGEMKQSEPQ
jgi:hypothetical protein